MAYNSQIATVEHDLLVQHITTLTAPRVDDVWRALHFAFDLPF